AAAEARKWQWADSEVQGQEAFGIAATSPQGGKRKKQAKKADNDDDDDIAILSGQKTKQQGGGKTLKEVTDQRWGELIQAVPSHMDVANSHLEKIASTAQSNGRKMQWHHLLMEGLVGQQQLLVSKLVEMVSTAGSGGAKEVAKDQEELKELQEVQGEGLGGQEGEMQGVPGGAPEDALGEELENGTGVEDDAGEEGQENKAKDKGKQKAL
ncbi:hypothetical protein ID866_13252, partial [Astraeus odoratus]